MVTKDCYNFNHIPVPYVSLVPLLYPLVSLVTWSMMTFLLLVEAVLMSSCRDLVAFWITSSHFPVCTFLRGSPFTCSTHY